MAEGKLACCAGELLSAQRMVWKDMECQLLLVGISDVFWVVGVKDVEQIRVLCKM